MSRTGTALVVAVLGLGGLVALAGPTAAAGCNPASAARGDIDGDGRADVVVGTPLDHDAAGSIDVRYTGLPSKVLRQSDFGKNGRDGSLFGSSIVVGDVDGDGCADVVAGAPRAKPGDLAPGEVSPSYGAVHILFGSPTGLLTGSVVTIMHTQTQLDDDFGAAVAVGPKAGDGSRELYVGAPDRESGADYAGAVFRYTLTPGGAKRVTVTADGLWTQDSPGVPGKVERNDHFGAVLVADEHVGGVIAAAPGENIGRAVNAGAIWYLGTDPDGTTFSRSYSQDSPGVPGVAETGDHFGSSLGMRGAFLAVGVPDENSGSRKDSGAVHLLLQSGTQKNFVSLGAFSQNSAGVPGAAEAGDRFGATVAVEQGIRCLKESSIAAGSPGEDVGSRTDAGVVTLFPWSASGCPALLLRQGSGLAGSAEAGDHLGAALSMIPTKAEPDETGIDRLLIGAPQESVGGKPKAGAVQPASGKILVNGTGRDWLTYSAGYGNTTSYGSVLGSTFG